MGMLTSRTLAEIHSKRQEQIKPSEELDIRAKLKQKEDVAEPKPATKKKK